MERAVANLLIRNIDPAVKEALRARAAQNGRSMESEARRIVSNAVAADQPDAPNLAEAIRRRLAPFGGVELEPHPPVPVRDPPAMA